MSVEKHVRAIAEKKEGGAHVLVHGKNSAWGKGWERVKNVTGNSQSKVVRGNDRL